MEILDYSEPSIQFPIDYHRKMTIIKLLSIFWLYISSYPEFMAVFYSQTLYYFYILEPLFNKTVSKTSNLIPNILVLYYTGAISPQHIMQQVIYDVVAG